MKKLIYNIIKHFLMKYFYMIYAYISIKIINNIIIFKKIKSKKKISNLNNFLFLDFLIQ